MKTVVKWRRRSLVHSGLHVCGRNVFSNCTAAQIIRIFEQMGRSEYPPSYKCLAVVFSGHGEENVLFGSDGKIVKIEEEVIGPLQPSELPTMRTVPKLFFIDACRGEMTMIPAVKSKGSPRAGFEKGGYFVAYSTTRGYRSYTCGEKSKWMPKIAHQLRSSDQSVQDIVAEIAKELRKDIKDMQCPEYMGSCQPVYLHQLVHGNGKYSGSGQQLTIGILHDIHVDIEESRTVLDPAHYNPAQHLAYTCNYTTCSHSES